jgi:trans-aconitate 2-methyltransferase
MPKFEWNAEEYTKFSSAQEKWARELLAKLDLKGNEDVLDLGCGDGKITVEIAKDLFNGTVTGVDNSEEMITLANEKYPKDRYKNLSFYVMDAKELIYTNRFDIVFSNAALHWVDDHRSALKGINRSLRKGGRILIQTGGKGNAAAAFKTIGEMTSMPEWRSYLEGTKSPYNFFSDEEYKVLIPETGFNPIRIELLEKDMIHDGIEGFKGFIRTTWLPYTLRIPEEKREQFISDAAQLYVSKYPADKEGKVHIGMVRLEVEAEKII